jgi:hypothetical protein
VIYRHFAKDVFYYSAVNNPKATKLVHNAIKANNYASKMVYKSEYSGILDRRRQLSDYILTLHPPKKRGSNLAAGTSSFILISLSVDYSTMIIFLVAVLSPLSSV